MDDYKKIAELMDSINEQMHTNSEEQTKLLEIIAQVKETFRIKINQVLTILEKEIEDGKITDMNTIQSIRGLRERYNLTFKN